MNPSYRAEYQRSEQVCAKVLVALSVAGMVAVASVAMLALAN